VAEQTVSDDDAISFARSAIGSVSALELLLLLRQDRTRPRPFAELVRELRSSDLVVARALEILTKFGLVEERPVSCYLYQTSSRQLDLICERLETVYAHKPVTLIRAILDAPDEKLRLFAQAFLLSGKDR
jgi:hypothetical protein